jgi:H+/Cl- antiporter ClcA
MFSFIATWYIFTITTYGTNVPAGLFLPGMIIGCGFGDLFFRLQVDHSYYGSSNDFINSPES